MHIHSLAQHSRKTGLKIERTATYICESRSCGVQLRCSKIMYICTAWMATGLNTQRTAIHIRLGFVECS